MEAGRELLSIFYKVTGHLNEFDPGSTNRDPKYALEGLQFAQGLVKA